MGQYVFNARALRRLSRKGSRWRSWSLGITRLAPREWSPCRPNTRTGERASSRSIVRQSYEIYRDQHAALKKFSLEEQTRGEKGSMSEMVREAIDAYIAKRLRQGSRAPAN